MGTERWRFKPDSCELCDCDAAMVRDDENGEYVLASKLAKAEAVLREIETFSEHRMSGGAHDVDSCVRCKAKNYFTPENDDRTPPPASGGLLDNARVKDLEGALRRCRELFSDIRGDWTDPRSECREGWAIIDAALNQSRTTPLVPSPGEEKA